MADNFQNLPELITPEQLREIVFGGNIGKNSLYKLLREGDFVIKIGRRLYISKEKFINWIKSRNNKCRF